MKMERTSQLPYSVWVHRRCRGCFKGTIWKYVSHYQLVHSQCVCPASTSPQCPRRSLFGTQIFRPSLCDLLNPSTPRFFSSSSFLHHEQGLCPEMVQFGPRWHQQPAEAQQGDPAINLIPSPSIRTTTITRANAPATSRSALGLEP